MECAFNVPQLTRTALLAKATTILMDIFVRMGPLSLISALHYWLAKQEQLSNQTYLPIKYLPAPARLLLATTRMELAAILALRLQLELPLPTANFVLLHLNFILARLSASIALAFRMQ
jgi:hypothetical protein